MLLGCTLVFSLSSSSPDSQGQILLGAASFIPAFIQWAFGRTRPCWAPVSFMLIESAMLQGAQGWVGEPFVGIAYLTTWGVPTGSPEEPWACLEPGLTLVREQAACPLCALLYSRANSSIHFVELLWWLNEIINVRWGLSIVSKHLLHANDYYLLTRKLVASRVNNVSLEAGWEPQWCVKIIHLPLNTYCVLSALLRACRLCTLSALFKPVRPFWWRDYYALWVNGGSEMSR